MATIPLAPLKGAEAPNEELHQPWECYHTPRADCVTELGFATLRSVNQIIIFDANRMELSDGKTYIEEAVPVLAPFFKARLTTVASAGPAAE